MKHQASVPAAHSLPMSSGHNRAAAKGFLRLIAATAAFMAVLMLLSGCAGSNPKSGKTDPDPRPLIRISSKRIGMSVPIVASLCAEFEREANCRVEFFHPELNVSDMLAVMRQFLEAQSPDLDIYDLDVIWPGILGEHMITMDPSPGFDPKDFVPLLIENNTVGGRLVAIPWYVDMAFLYVRTDLMAEAGTTVPRTFKDFPKLATAFAQLRERRAAQGQDPSWPYPIGMNLDPQEGMTCIALEWLHAFGAGAIARANGDVDVSPSVVTELLTTATTWVGSVFPPDVMSNSLNDTHRQFEEGRVAMMRNWTHAYAMVNGPDSPLAGKVEVHPLPQGRHGRFNVLGGFQFGVSKYSKHPQLAKRLVEKLTGLEAQRRHAIEGGFFPTRPALWADPAVMDAIPHLRGLTHTNAIEGLIVRPSRVAGARYNELSASIFEEFNRAMSGMKTPQQATLDLIAGVRGALRK